MSQDIFMKIPAFPIGSATPSFPGIKGESKDSQHKDEFDILSFGFGISNSGTTRGGGSGAGKATLTDFAVTMFVSKGVPTLFKDAASGVHIPTVDISLRKAGGRTDSNDYLHFKLSDVLITSLFTGGSNAVRDYTDCQLVSFGRHF